MGRSSKFSFSLSGRKASVAKDADIGTEKPKWQPSMASQSTLKMSKVERLLGTTGLPVRPSPSYDTLERATLASQPSYMALTASEGSDEEIETPMSASTASANHYHAPPRNESLRHRASMNMLGNSTNVHRGGKPVPASLNTRQLHSEQSSSTLRSYYDAQKSPPFISQQTSESAVRDKALRKGLPPVIPVDDSYEDSTDDDGPSFPQYRSLASSQASTTLQPKPARLDISRLFPRPRTSSSNVLGPHDVFRSPSQLSVATEHLPPPHSAVHLNGSPQKPAKSPAVLQKPRPNTTRLAKQPSNASSSRQVDHLDNPKSNIRRPPKGIKHWFDGFLDEDESSSVDGDEVAAEKSEPATIESQSSLSDEDDLPQLNNSRYFKVRVARGGSVSSSIPPNPLRSHPTGRHLPASVQGSIHGPELSEGYAHFGASDSSEESSSRSRSTTFSDPLRRSMEDSVGSRLAGRPMSGLQVQQTSIHNRESFVSHQTVTSENFRVNKLSDMDLRKSSALSLSSSEGGVGGEEEADSHLPVVRDSILFSDSPADNVLIGKAQAFQIKQSKKRPSEPIRVPGPAELDFPRTEPRSAGPVIITSQGHRALPDLFQSTLQAEPVRPHTSAAAQTPPRKHSSLPSRGTKRQSLRSDVADTPSSGHRLIAVTPEEEALLEMMRSKRAALVTQSFRQGYETALQEEERRDKSRPSSLQAESILATVDGVVNRSILMDSATRLETHSEQQALPEESTSSEPSSPDADITANSTLTEIMDAFPSPSPTSNRFSTTFLPRNDENTASPGLSTTGSSRDGRIKRHSALSTVSSNRQSTNGTSIASSLPAPKVGSSEVDEEASNSGKLSNASTVKNEQIVKKLSTAAGDVPITLQSDHVDSEKTIIQNAEAQLPRNEEQDSQEIIIKASESIVCNNDTDDLNSPDGWDDAQVHDFPSVPTTSVPVGPGSLQRTLPERRSMRVGISAQTSGRPTSFAASGSPRKFADRRMSKASAEYRLMPKISQMQQTKHEAQAQNTPRSMSVPTLYPANSRESSASNWAGRPRIASTGSSSAPNIARHNTGERIAKRNKPRAINMANVRKAFSGHRDATLVHAPVGKLPNMNKQPKRPQGQKALRAATEPEPRSSVSEDVLNAWSNLGGWRGFDVRKGEAPIPS